MKLLYRNLEKKIDTVDFSAAYDLYWQPMYLYAKSILKNRGDAEDVVQEVFTNLLKNWDQFEIKSSLKNYLFTSLRNQSLLKIRKTNRENEYIHELSQVDFHSFSFTDDEQRFNELSDILDKHIEKLTDNAKVIFLKNRFEGLRHKEIAQELGISEETSRTTLYRILKGLRSHLKPFLSAVIFILLKHF